MYVVSYVKEINTIYILLSRLTFLNLERILDRGGKKQFTEDDS